MVNSHSQALWRTPAIQGTEDDTFKDNLDNLARASSFFLIKQ